MGKVKANSIHQEVEALLKAASWSIQVHEAYDLKKSLGVAVRDFPLARAYGQIDYLLFLEGKAVGLIEVCAKNTPLQGVPLDSEKYRRGLPFTLRLFTRPLPFLYQSSGGEVCFTNFFDPLPKPRKLVGFHRPETLRTWLEDGMVGETPRDMAAEHFPEHRRRGRSFQERVMINVPPLLKDGLSSEQYKAIKNLETSLSENRARALVEISSGVERMSVILHLIERLLKFADARRVLVFVNDAEVAKKMETAITQIPPAGDEPFTEAFPLEHLQEDELRTDSRLCIATLSGLLSRLSAQDTLNGEKPLRYNTAFPIESFEVLLLASCDILSSPLRAALAYFDTRLIAFTEKASQETADFFEQNLVMGYKEVQAKPEKQSDGLHVISSDLL